MSGTPGNGWLTYSLLRRLLPPVFFHHIWTEFVHTKSPYPPQLIEELNQAAEQLVTNNDVENACQVWLICAALESRRGNNKKALKLTEKTSEFAQNHQLPKILEWSNWGASSLCARRGNWQQATHYLQSLQEELNNQGEWMLASVISILETNLYQLVIAEQGSSPDPAVDPQMAIILEQFLQWETPNLTPEMTPTAAVEDDSLFKRFWQSLKDFFKGETRKRPTERPSSETSSKLPAIQSYAEVDTSVTKSEPDSPTIAAPVHKPSEVERPQTVIKSQPAPPTETETQPEVKPLIEPEHTGPSLTIYCLGIFQVYQHDRLLTDWNGLKSQILLKYLLVQKGKSVAKEVLMDVFWPESEPEAARRNLHQAIYSLRQTLHRGDPDFQHILFEHDRYLLNPDMDLWLDFEEFRKHVQAGRRLEAAGQLTEAMAEYGIAEGLYQGSFLEEDLYEEWCQWQRERFRDMYLDISNRLGEHYLQVGEYTAAMVLCQKVLAQDNCHEQAHFRLMRCYFAQHQRHLAVRQYQICQEVLKSELELEPSEETTALYRELTTSLSK